MRGFVDIGAPGADVDSGGCLDVGAASDADAGTGGGSMYRPSMVGDDSAAVAAGEDVVAAAAVETSESSQTTMH